MQPLTKQSSEAGTLARLPIADPLTPLTPLTPTQAIAYDKSQPRQLVQHFVDACREHFSDARSERCIIDEDTA